jgi:hypothetical protein
MLSSRAAGFALPVRRRQRTCARQARSMKMASRGRPWPLADRRSGCTPHDARPASRAGPHLRGQRRQSRLRRPLARPRPAWPYHHPGRARCARARPVSLDPASARPAGAVHPPDPAARLPARAPSRTAGRVDVRAFGMVEGPVDVRNLVLTNTRDGATRAVPVHRVGRGHYTGRLAVDENDRLAVIVHLRGGARLRSVFEMPAEQQRSSFGARLDLERLIARAVQPRSSRGTARSRV